MAAQFSVDLGLMPETDARRTVELIRLAGLPVDPPPSNSIDREQFLQLMSVDKKVQDGQLRLVLMQGIGKAFVTADFSLEALAQSLDRMIPS
jgi:3-dehydroquinate synthase